MAKVRFIWLGEDMIDGWLLMCPECGERGVSHWEGPNRRPNTANRGLFVGLCGQGYGCPYSYRHGADHDDANGCHRFFIACYRCSWFGRAIKVPRNLLVVAP